MTLSRKHVRRNRTARFRLSSKVKNAHDQWHFRYLVVTPTDKPFLPSDEALRILVGRYPRLRFVKSYRHVDYDTFLVRGVKDNFFRPIAAPEQQKLRRKFLRDVADIALEEREIRPIVLEKAKQFLERCEFKNMTWDGSQVIAYTKGNHRYESRRDSVGSLRREFRKIIHACKTEPPFFIGAAL